MAKAKEIEGLDCAAPARAGVALVLRTRFEEMCAYRAAALDWSDPTGVHDMRVASRRLRSLVRDCAPYLRRRLPRKRLRALASALGAVRDEDVTIAALEKLSVEAGPELAAGFNPLLAEHQRRREEARALLTLALEEASLVGLETKFLRRLERATIPRRADAQSNPPAAQRDTAHQPEDASDKAGGTDKQGSTADEQADAAGVQGSAAGEQGSAADRQGSTTDDQESAADDQGATDEQGSAADEKASAAGERGGVADVREGVAGGRFAFRQAGQEIIAARLRELIAGGRALYRPDNAHGLHDLRIAAKRLRYALELFDPCFESQLKEAAASVAHLQQALGDLHDCDVWLADLAARLKALDAPAAHEAAPAAPPDAPTASAAAHAAPAGAPALERRATFWLLAHFVEARAAHYRAALEHWGAWEAEDFFERLTDLSD
ncbi:MAG TPA: CHAD domain-containing protein [Pyrinomonadaceae bacterium]|jgi:CHAD domain-containing protein